MDERIVCLIGIGKVGSALAFELNEIGFKRVYIIDRILKRVNLIAKKLDRIRQSDKITKKIITDSDVVLISVQDNEISNVVRRISKLKVNLKEKIFLHTSGALNSEVFEALRSSLSCPA